MDLKAFMIFFGSALFSFQVQAGSLIRLKTVTIDPSQNISVQSSPVQRTWIVSFSKPITESLKKEVQRKGFEILSFIPDSALLIRGERQKHSFSDQVAWVPYQASWKWSPHLQIPSVMNANLLQTVIVRTHTLRDSKDLLAKLNAMDVEVLDHSKAFSLVRATQADLFKISKWDEVAHLSEVPDFKLMKMEWQNPNSSLETRAAEVTGYETGTRVMNFESAWQMGFTGQNQIVAMGDTGLDRGDLQNIHPDFQNAVVSGKNFAPFGRSWEDPMGHGTHVAGSILSRGTASSGAFKGGAYDARIVVHGLWSPMMNNLMLPSKLGDMFQSALQSGASVHTNSWGQAKNFGGYDSFARQVDEFIFNNPDLLILFAAGNSGVDKNRDGRIDSDSIGSPATAKNTLSVGASENLESQGGIQRPISDLRGAQENWSMEPIWSSKLSDNPRGIAVFSSRGPTDDGRIKPEIVAPGTNILSTISHHPKAEVLWGKYNDEYVWSGGTSMATPLTAGAAAVTRQILQQKFSLDKPSSSLVKAFMMSFATDLYPGQYGEGGAARGQEILNGRPNNDEGFGLVNMKAQVETPAEKMRLVDQRAGVATGETQEVEFTVSEKGTLTVLLLWNDAPGSESAARALVNNLDLRISGPHTESVSNDSVNNFEFFEKSAEPGVYKIKVTGQQVPQGLSGKQPYSLVIRVQ